MTQPHGQGFIKSANLLVKKTETPLRRYLKEESFAQQTTKQTKKKQLLQQRAGKPGMFHVKHF